MDLATELQRIYDSEINVEIAWLWDGGRSACAITLHLIKGSVALPRRGDGPTTGTIWAYGVRGA